MPEHNGFITVLDALGAAKYSQNEIVQFLESRQRVLMLLESKAEAVFGHLDARRISTFIFNDTLVIAYPVEPPVSMDHIEAFGMLLRHFELKSIVNGILFRGAMSIGTFYSDEDTNTIMGSAVTDAAAWYDKADWIGITTTPQATLIIRARERQAGKDVERVFIDYLVPMSDHTKPLLRAVNWPKGFYVKGLRPLSRDEDPKAKCLDLLVRSGIPKGTETKYFNTIEFFDHCVRRYKARRRKSSSAS